MSQRKKIIFLSKYYSPHVGGVEKHVEKVTKKLINKNFDLIIITEQFDKSLPLIEKSQNLKIYRIPVTNNENLKKFYIWKWFFSNLKILKSAKIVHVHDVFYWILPFRFLLRNHRFFITFHGYEGYPLRIKWKVLRKIYEKISDGNICVGDFMKKWYGTRPNFVIYGGCDDIKNKVKAKSKSILFFGRLDSQTNVLEYIKSFDLLHKNDKKWSLDVYGEGNLKNKMPKLVKIHDFNANLSQEIQKFEYVFVSRYLSMLEAMMAKRLIFAYYDNEIKRDYLLNSPFKKYVVSANSPKKLADKLEYYSKNKAEKDKIIREGFAFAKKQTWGEVVDTYLRLWKNGR